VLRIFLSMKYPNSFLSFGIASHAFFIFARLLVSSILTVCGGTKNNGEKRRKGDCCRKTTTTNKEKRQRQEDAYFSLISCRDLVFFSPFPFSLCYLKSSTFSIFNFETFVTLFLPFVYFCFALKNAW